MSRVRPQGTFGPPICRDVGSGVSLAPMVRENEDSKKIEHMKLLHYVSLMVERAEMVASSATTQMPVARPKPKAKSQSAPPMPEISDDEEDPWMAAEMTGPPTYR